MASARQARSNHAYSTAVEPRPTSPVPHFNYETYYKHREKEPEHTNALLQYLSDTELKFRNDNLYEASAFRLPRRTDILNRYVKMNPNFEHLNRVYEPNLTTIEKQRYKRCITQQQQKLHRIKKKFDFQTADGHDSHYFLTGARYNRFDTVDSKILLKYGTFINRNNPEQVEIKPSHFKKFREILQAQQRSSAIGNGTIDTGRRDTDHNTTGERRYEEDLDDLTNRYDRSSSRQSSLKATGVNRRSKLPKLKDPARYIEVGSQMPEGKRGRRSVDRAVSSSSTHRSSRHRRHSQLQQQQQQQQIPPQQSSVSYVANKVSFSLASEPTAPVMTGGPTATTTYKPNEDEYEHQQRKQQLIGHDSIDVDDDDEIGGNKNELDNPVVIERLREQATMMISNILTSAFEQLQMATTS